MSDCDLTNTTIKAGEWIHYVSKELILPSYLVIGTVCNALLLVAFYKQSKIEKPYVYQVLLTTSKTLEVIVFGSYLIGQDWWSGYYTKGADWFQKSYLIMFIQFRFGAVLQIHLIMSSVLLAAAMAADRVFALSFPVRYKNTNHGRHQLVAGLICFTLPAIASISCAWIWQIVPEGDRFVIKIDFDYTQSIISRLCSQAGIGLRLIALATLILANVISIRLFGKRSKALVKLGQEKMAVESKAAEKTLMILSVSQSVLMCINQIPHVGLLGMFYIAPHFSLCQNPIISPLADFFIFLTDMADVAVVLAVNERIRQMVKRVIGCGRWQVGTENPAAENAGVSQVPAWSVGGAQRARNNNAAVHT